MDKATLELAGNWLLKAQRDLATARKVPAGPEPYLDTAIYHCQQAAEKAIKGLLVFYGQRFEKVHNVQLLVTLAQPFAPELGTLLEAAERLTPYATAFRYPGSAPTIAVASDMTLVRCNTRKLALLGVQYPPGQYSRQSHSGFSGC